MMLDPEPPGFIRGRDNPLATVGMFERSEWGGGFYATFAAGEVVRVRRPIPSIVVQSFGRPLPPFASASLFIDHQPDFELDLIYEASWIETEPVFPPERFLHIKPQQRFVLCAPSLTSALMRKNSLPQIDLLIAAEPDALKVLGEALAIVLTGNLLIGADISDLHQLAGIQLTCPALGYAVELDGLCDAQMAAVLRCAITKLGSDGYGGSLFLMQLVAAEDNNNFTLAKFDAFARAVLSDAEHRLTVLTASVQASRTAAILIVFSGIV